MAQTFSCPSCGAPLETQGDKTTILCKYCGESVIVPDNLRDHPHSNRSRKTTSRQVNVSVSNTTQASKHIIRAVIFFVVIFIAGAFILPLIFAVIPLSIGLMGAFNSFKHDNTELSDLTKSVSALAKPDMRLDSGVIFPPDEDTLMPDFLALVRDNKTDVYQFEMVDGKNRTSLWRSEDLGKKGSDARAFFLKKQVFIINETTLTALDRLTGKSLWKIQLDNGLGYCKTCLVQSGNSVIVLLKDGTVQAVDAASGKLTWHKTLISARYDLFLANGQPAVQDNDENDRNVIYIFDPLSGKIMQRLQPGCPAKKPDVYFGSYELNPDGKSLLIFYENCLQTVSLPEGKVLTEVLGPQANTRNSAWPFAWFATKYLVTSDSIFYTMEGSSSPLNVMSIAKGNPKQLISDKKYSLTPKFLLGNVLVTEAIPGFDGSQVEYWGVDTSSGQRLWQYALKGQGEMRYHDIHETSDGIFVIQCRESPGNCTWANIDPKTGVGNNSGSVPGGTFFDPAWYKDTLYLESEGVLMVINTLTGKLLYQWP